MTTNKFKIGDRVRNLYATQLVEIGELGTVLDNCAYPYIKWDSGLTTLRSQDEIELITDEQPEVNEIVEAAYPELRHFKPTYAGKTEQEWLWEFAGRAMQSHRLIQVKANHEVMAIESVRDAKALIAELKKGGEE